MKKNLRGRIREFVRSEEGKVGVKSPLTLGVAVGSVLLTQAIIGPTPAMACLGDTDCLDHEHCGAMVEVCVWDPCLGEICWWEGECLDD